VAKAIAADGVRLHYETTGSGSAILFIHEFAGDLESWEPQIRFFSPRHRCISYNARGYPPSDVPGDSTAYSQQIAIDDAVAVLDAAGVDEARVVGLSMGGFCALHLALQHPGRVRCAVVAGCGYGAHPDARAGFRGETAALADAFDQEGSARVAARYAVGPARVQFQAKDPAGWSVFARRLGEHSAVGAAHTMRGVQRARPSLYDLTEQLAELTMPVLLITGDEDENCLEPALMLKRTIPTAGLFVLPRTGHTINLEEPAVFNDAVAQFFAAVEADAWTSRDPRSRSTSTIGLRTPD
jgi:pimeloyl-ACP methyl ester carboxylesterase